MRPTGSVIGEAGTCYAAAMEVRIVFLGDIVGAPGRLAVKQQLPAIRERWSPDLVIANAENVAAGTGLTPELYQKLSEAGIDGFTLGDHIYKKKQIVSVLEREANILRPANLPSTAKGRPWMRLRCGETAEAPTIYVLTLLGRLFMPLPCDEPFAAADRVLEQLPERNPIVIVEAHMEATSEKEAMGWHLNGRVAAVLGSHTHVPTADARLLPTHGPGLPEPPAGARGQTAYITDMGMCGPHDAVLGRRADRVLTHMTSAMPAPFDVAEGNPRVQGVVLDVDTERRSATAIEPIDLPADRHKPPFTAR